MNFAPWQLRRTFFITVSVASLATSLFSAELFDGKTLSGWEGDPKWWRVQDGTLTPHRLLVLEVEGGRIVRLHAHSGERLVGAFAG